MFRQGIDQVLFGDGVQALQISANGMEVPLEAVETSVDAFAPLLCQQS